MPIVLSDINEKVDRSIEEVIYQITLGEGLTPNRDTVADRAAYDTALSTIKSNVGYAVEVFGSSSNDAKDAKRVPRIVYNNLGFVGGNLGGSVQFFYEVNGATFDKKTMPPMTGNLRFKVTLTSKTAQQDRMLHAIMSAAMPNRSYINFYDDADRSFMIRYLYSAANPDLKEGLIEKVYFYEAIDLFETNDIVVSTGVVPITEIIVQSPEGDEINNIT